MRQLALQRHLGWIGSRSVRHPCSWWKSTSRAVPPAIFTPVRRRAQRHQGLSGKRGAAHNRGGDRQANSALWRIVLVRMSHDPRTKAYVARRTAEGKTTKEIIRCLKRYVAREIYKALAHQARTPVEIAARQAAA